ncbi:MAG: diguanylate cyclase [Clostridia bacterium]|nr:diguanylate cyclase [Clostridia bacterium]
MNGESQNIEYVLGADSLVRQKLAEIQEERKLPFRLDLSLGQYIRPATSEADLDSCLQAADMKMYEVKNQKKTRRMEAHV